MFVKCEKGTFTGHQVRTARSFENEKLSFVVDLLKFYMVVRI